MNEFPPREPVLCLNKPSGYSPVQALDAARRALPGYADAVLGYAGRLDPLAEGVLLALVDGENKRAGCYLGLDKRYRVEVLFGFVTDSYDPLGVVRARAAVRVDAGAVREACARAVGTFEQPYPPFSSARVRGRPMFHWARKGALPEGAQAPARERSVYACDLLGVHAVGAGELLARVERAVGRVRGDFRQTAVLASWRAALSGAGADECHDVATLDVRCSSGTYMRSLAHEMGQALGPGALALRIVRTEAGPYSLAGALRVAGEGEYAEDGG